jgi:hypothetical protein
MKLDVLEDTRVEIELDDEGNEKLAHYAESTSVTEAYVLGTPVQALCGKVFIPSRDPEKLRKCPICVEIMDALFYPMD